MRCLLATGCCWAVCCCVVGCSALGGCEACCCKAFATERCAAMQAAPCCPVCCAALCAFPCAAPCAARCASLCSVLWCGMLEMLRGGMRYGMGKQWGAVGLLRGVL